MDQIMHRSVSEQRVLQTQNEPEVASIYTESFEIDAEKLSGRNGAWYSESGQVLYIEDCPSAAHLLEKHLTKDASKALVATELTESVSVIEFYGRFAREKQDELALLGCLCKAAAECEEYADPISMQTHLTEVLAVAVKKGEAFADAVVDSQHRVIAGLMILVAREAPSVFSMLCTDVYPFVLVPSKGIDPDEPNFKLLYHSSLTPTANWIANGFVEHLETGKLDVFSEASRSSSVQLQNAHFEVPQKPRTKIGTTRAPRRNSPILSNAVKTTSSIGTEPIETERVQLAVKSAVDEIAVRKMEAELRRKGVIS